MTVDGLSRICFFASLRRFSLQHPNVNIQRKTNATLKKEGSTSSTKHDLAECLINLQIESTVTEIKSNR